MKKEEKLILQILRNNKVNVNNINWSRFLKIANKNGLSGTLYKRIQASKISFPKNIITEFRNFYFYNSKRNLVLLNELKKILMVLEQYNEEVILIKGFSTTHLTKQDIGERLISDIDILCLSKKDKVIEEIKKLGYTESKEYSTKFYEHYVHNYPSLIKKVLKINVLVEVHHQLDWINSPFLVQIKDINTIRKTIFNRKVKFLQNEDALLYYCRQTSYNNLFTFGIRNLLDIKNIIKENKINWKEIIKKSELWKCSAYVYQSLYLSKKLLKANIPNEVLERIKKKSSWWELMNLNLARKNLFTTKNYFSLNSEKWILRMLLGRSLKQKIKILSEASMFMFFKLKKKYA